jgi:hypothetical protein
MRGRPPRAKKTAGLRRILSLARKNPEEDNKPKNYQGPASGPIPSIRIAKILHKCNKKAKGLKDKGLYQLEVPTV